MTDRELHKLGRRELLQMMLESGKEAEKYRKQLNDTEELLARLEQTNEHLRRRLDRKDAQIHDLKEALLAEQQKKEIELKEAGSIAEAALRLNGVFEAAQKAAEQYIYNVRRLHDAQLEKDSMEEIRDSETIAQSAKNDEQRDLHEQGKGQERDGDSVAGSDRGGASEGTA